MSQPPRDPRGASEPTGPWPVPDTDDARGVALARFVSERAGVSFNQAKRWVLAGKVYVEGRAVVHPGERVPAGHEVELRPHVPRIHRRPLIDIVFQDDHVVVLDKPSGMSSVPYERGERGTAMDALRDAWKAQGRRSRSVPIHVVHRIDRGTSGLLMFATSKRAELGLARQLREHSLEREYVCVAHGRVEGQRIESQLVRDRGDGLRGSARHPGQGKRAVTHVEVIEHLPRATLCRVHLETGKTHQIRIHLAEAGHPLVGDTVYVRDYQRLRQPLPSARLLLHARTLGFVHPITGADVMLTREPGPDFRSELDRLR